MEKKTSTTAWKFKHTGIKRRRREDLVVRVFKPGTQLQQILSKAERRKKDDKLLDADDDEDNNNNKERFSPPSGSPRSLVSTPVEMYRKFWHGANVASQMATNARETEDKNRSRIDSTTTSPRSFRPRWPLSRPFVRNRSPGAKDCTIGQRKRNSTENKDSDYDDNRTDYKPDYKAKNTLKRSDSIITVVRASSNDQKEASTAATSPSPLPPPPEPYSRRPIYIHGPIRLQEGALAPFSARKDSIASLEAFLTAAAVEPFDSVKESRRVSDDAAEKDIVSFFDSYGFGVGVEDDDRLDRFWEEEEEGYQAHDKGAVDYEEVEDEDRDTICNGGSKGNGDVDSESDIDSETLNFSPTSSGNRFVIDGMDPFCDVDDEKNSYYVDDDDDIGNAEATDIEFFYEPETESESEVIEIALAEPLVDKMLAAAS